MSAQSRRLPPRYLRTPEAARFVGLSIRTLEKHRIYGTGPRYSKLGGRVVYRARRPPGLGRSRRQGVHLRPWRRAVLPAKRHTPAAPAAAGQARR